MKLPFLDWTVTFEKRPIKHVYLSITPEGDIRLRAPQAMSVDQALEFLQTKEAWLRTKLADRPVMPVQRWNDDEPIGLFGQTYRLKRQDRTLPVRVVEDVIYLPEGSEEAMAAALADYYREVLQAYLGPRVKAIADRMKLYPNEWRIRAMKTRWGSCNVTAGRIWFSLELAKKDPGLIDYVIVHELAHLYERGHNARFYAKVAEWIPDWKRLRQELNQRSMD